MRRQRTFNADLLVYLMLLLAFTSIAVQLLAAPRVASWFPGLQSDMFQNLQNLEREFSIDHTVHWRHGEVTTSMSVAPTNFDGCSVVWAQTQEATRPGQLFYIETHRFEVPLATMDAKQITVQPVGAGQNERPGIEPGDYYTVLLQSSSGKKSVNLVDHNIVFNQKQGPIPSVEQLMVSSAWVRVRHDEQGETLKTLFQQAITACIAAGQ
ncbi:MAG TPA: hypothetical protein VK829_17935 [Terriglobales bacterium]|jgi:hypothetical protein|nr:hypothetical protein [Terriglobales bacterium]